MTMKTADLPIAAPCAVPWSAMSGDDRRRFCAACREHVTDISQLTEREGRRFLEAQPDACVQMHVLGETILFEPERRRSATLRRPGRLLRSVVQVGVLGLGAATPAFASGEAADGGSAVVEWITSWLWGERKDAPEEEKKREEPLPAPDGPAVDTGLEERVPPVRRLRGRPWRPTHRPQ